MLTDREVQRQLPRGSNVGECWCHPGSRLEMNITLSCQCSCRRVNVVDLWLKEWTFYSENEAVWLKISRMSLWNPPGSWPEITRKPVLL